MPRKAPPPPPPKIDNETLVREWEDAKRRLADAQAHEMRCRLALAVQITNPREGTNNLNISEHMTVKVKHVINRTVDAAAVPSVVKALPEPYRSQLFPYKPGLDTTLYRTLTPDLLLVVADAVTSKPGTPQIEVVRDDDIPARETRKRKGRR